MNQYKLMMQISGGYAEAYLQFRTFDDEIAGYMNVAISSSTGKEGIFPLYGPNSVSAVDITKINADLLITVSKYDQGMAIFQIYYEET
jgi:hypothetical protein